MFEESARFYDAIYAFKNYESEARQIHELIQVYKQSAGRALLDVGCGTGAHIGFLREHYEVEGLDLDAEILAVARERFSGVPFHHADMADFDLSRQFDVIMCLFSSIGYVKTLDKLKDAVGSMTVHLKPQGVLAIEPWFTPENWHPNTVHGTYVDEPDLKIARINTSFVKGKVSVFDLHHLVGTPEGTEYLVEHHELGLFEVEQMISVMEQAGLTVKYNADGLTGRGLYIGRKNG